MMFRAIDWTSNSRIDPVDPKIRNTASATQPIKAIAILNMTRMISPMRAKVLSLFSNNLIEPIQLKINYRTSIDGQY